MLRVTRRRMADWSAAAPPLRPTCDGLPAPEAYKGMQAAERTLADASTTNDVNFLARILLPSLSKANLIAAWPLIPPPRRSPR